MRILFAAVAAVLILAFGYAFLGVPGKDDLCFASAPMSPLAIANDLYLTWSGRWLGNFLAAIVTKSGDMFSWQYGALTALSFPLWLSGFYAIASSVLDRHRLPSSLLMLGVFWAANPSPYEVFYWLTGVVFYAVPFALGALAIFLLSRRSWLSVFPAIAASLISELAGIVLVVGLIPFLRRREVQIVFLGSLAATLVVALSPGNAARIATNQDVSVVRLFFLCLSDL